MTTTLILGGGFGGLACARRLRTLLPSGHRIVLVDRSPAFLVGAAKTWVMLGERAAEDVAQPRTGLVPPGVQQVNADVRRIDPARRSVETSAGTLQGEHLVIALGADLDMEAVPGLAHAAHSFYALGDAVRLRGALQSFRGGRLVLLIPRTPFKCPPAPYEAALLLHDALRRRGLRDQTTLEVWTVEKAPMPTAGPEMGKTIVAELESRGIGFCPLRKATAADAAARRVRFEDGSETGYDLLVAIPPHVAPRCVVEAGLAPPGGWIAVDPLTLEVRTAGTAPHLYAVGDVAGVPLPGRYDPAVPLVLPKAGVFAAAQGEVVAERIAAAVRGGATAAAFDGKGYCYIEVGDHRAMRGDGSFFETPHPVMRARPPDEAQYRDKLEWVEAWMAATGR